MSDDQHGNSTVYLCAKFLSTVESNMPVQPERYSTVCGERRDQEGVKYQIQRVQRIVVACKFERSFTSPESSFIGSFEPLSSSK